MKQTLLFMVLALGMCDINGKAQTKKSFRSTTRQVPTSSVVKSRKMGIDGKIWFLIKKENLFGAQDETGKEILPVEFSSIYYKCDEKSGIRYFYAEQNGYAGIWSILGNCIISPNKRYDGIELETRKDKMCWRIKINGKYGIIDTKEKEIIPPKYYYLSLTSYHSSDPVYIQVWDENMKHQGICDLNGKVLLEPIYSSCLITHYDGLGTYIRKDGKDEKLSSYSEDSRFDYHIIEDIKGEPFERQYYQSYSIDGKIYYSKIEKGSFKVFNENYQIIVPLSKGYDAIWAFCDDNGTCRCLKVRKDGMYGIVNSQGTEIASPEFQELEYAGANLIKFKINDCWGLMNFTGKIIIPSSRGYTSIGSYLKSQKTFPYTMYGYKGECDAVTGRQLSKIKVETTQQQVVVKKEEMPQKQEEKKIIIEHRHDPVPVQQWQACFACGGMGTMGCDNCGGGGTKYIGDRLHRCSRCNGRGIIPCNICHGNKGQYITVYQ